MKENHYLKEGNELFLVCFVMEFEICEGNWILLEFVFILVEGKNSV
jgi:hypothetical protein